MGKGRILIVDDQLGIRLLLNEVFQKEGYEIYQAANGIMALEVADRYSPDLVLLDMKIPGMDGMKVLKRLKDMNSSITVIMMTAYGDQEMINEAKRLGARTHITKPFDIGELANTVNQLFEDKSVKKI